MTTLTAPPRVLKLKARRRCTACDRPLIALSGPSRCDVCVAAESARRTLESLIDGCEPGLVLAAADWLQRIDVDRRIFLNPGAYAVLEDGVRAAVRVIWSYESFDRSAPSAVRTVRDPILPPDEIDVDAIPF